jgi:hypothetical protein
MKWDYKSSSVVITGDPDPLCRIARAHIAKEASQVRRNGAQRSDRLCATEANALKCSLICQRRERRGDRRGLPEKKEK